MHAAVLDRPSRERVAHDTQVEPDSFASGGKCLSFHDLGAVSVIVRVVVVVLPAGC